MSDAATDAAARNAAKQQEPTAAEPNTELLTDPEEAVRFLTALYGPNIPPIFIQRLPNIRDDTVRKPWWFLGAPEAIRRIVKLKDQAGFALYFCIGLLPPIDIYDRKPKGDPRAKSRIIGIRVLSVDIDAKDHPTRSPDDILAAIREFPLRPTVIVESGSGGLHVYYRLDQLLDYPSNEIMARTDACMRRLARLLGGDPLPVHFATLMRLPGSTNSKHGQVKAVRMVACHPEIEYRFEEFEQSLTEFEPVLVREQPSSERQKGNGSDQAGDPYMDVGRDQASGHIDVEGRLEAMRWEGVGETAIHHTQLHVTASLLNGVELTVEQIVERVLAATREAVAKDARAAGWNWDRERRKLEKMCLTFLAKDAELRERRAEAEADAASDAKGDSSDAADEEDEAEAEAEDEANASTAQDTTTGNGTGAGAAGTSGTAGTGAGAAGTSGTAGTAFAAGSASTASAGTSAKGTKASLLAELNAQYAVVREGGKTRVLYFEEHEYPIDNEKSYTRRVPAFQSFNDFRQFLSNCYIKIKGKARTLGSWWLANPKRRQYAGLTFQPGKGDVVNGRLNLWQGFAFQPVEGDWSLLREHIRVVLANGDQAADEYIVRWIAWMVQHPAERAEVALVFKGKRGTGRGTLGTVLFRLLGQHAHHISSAKHLTGDFNAHLRDCVFLFADEAYWPGDKAAEGGLKRLITEPTLHIEYKGRDTINVPNFLHALILSNEYWIVPAGEFERRFVAFEVSTCHLQDAAWFAPLYKQLENGGYAAMLYDLLKYDLGNWHPRKIIRTEELLNQQRASLSPEDQWWVELLETGVLAGTDGIKHDSAVSTSYELEEQVYAGTKRVKVKGLYEQAREMSPRLRQYTADHRLGHFLTEKGCRRSWVSRKRAWRFPPLLKARADWETRFPGWRWHDPHLKDWGPGEDDGSHEQDGDEGDGEAETKVKDETRF